MTLGGWFSLILSWAGILTLTGFCFLCIFRKDSGLD